MIDVVISGCVLFDGERIDGSIRDIAIVGDRVALIGDLSERDANERVDARGLTLAPGFIDTHSHSDELWLADGRCLGKLMQGVTTEIAGNCGTSAAPLQGLAFERTREIARDAGVDVDWRDVDAFLSAVARSGVAINVATLAGLGTIRRCVRGDEPGRLDAAERRALTDLVSAAVEQGAVGISSGLAYVPSRYADETELVACARAAAAAGAARYATHLRSESDDMLGAVDEALRVARASDVALQVSHHKAAGRKNWGSVHRSLDAIAQARADGLDVHVDVYPYVAMATDLSTILPDDALAGGRDAALERLDDPQTAAALALRLQLDRPADADWHDVLISNVRSRRNEELIGRRLDDIARMWRLSPARAAVRLLREEALDVDAIFFAMNEDDVATVLSAGFTTIGSDASARATTGPTARGLPHPRTFGCFPRVIGRFVRQRRTLELSEALRRMTSLAADAFGLSGRGRVTPGAYADLVLFDAGAIVDTATYDRPYAYPDGIDSVWVNGRAAVRRGEPTVARAGRVLRGGR